MLPFDEAAFLRESYIFAHGYGMLRSKANSDSRVISLRFTF